MVKDDKNGSTVVIGIGVFGNLVNGKAARFAEGTRKGLIK